MQKTKSKFLLTAFLGVSLVTAITFTSCNNDGDKKEPEKTETPPATTDSPKMNTAPATTEPAKAAQDSTAKTDTVKLKKMVPKPLGTKP